jgi:hypothetical protein
MKLLQKRGLPFFEESIEPFGQKDEKESSLIKIGPFK